MTRILFILLISHGWLLSAAQEFSLKHLRTYSGHDHGVRKVVFSNDGIHFASGSTRGELFIWDIDGSGSLKKLQGHFGSIVDVRYSLDGNHLVSTGEDGVVKVWDANTGALEQEVAAFNRSSNKIGKVNFAMMCGASNQIFFGTDNGELREVDFMGESEPRTVYKDPKESVQCGIVSSEANEVIIAAGQYLLAINIETGQIVQEYNTGSCSIKSLEFSKDSNRLLTWCSNSRVDVRDPDTFFLITSFRSGSSARRFSNMAFTEDQKYVLTGDHASRFNLWDLEKKRLVLDQWAEQGTILTFDLEGESNYILSGSLDKTIKLWQMVPKIEEEKTTKKKKTKVQEIEVVEPQVEIVQYDEPFEDVPQTEEIVEPTDDNNVNLNLSGTSLNDSLNAEKRPTPTGSVLSVLPERVQNRRVKPIRREHKLKLNGSKLVFEIWDAQVIDGDIVSIYVGDECIVKEYSITAAKKSVTFDASRFKRVYVYLHAHNLGTLPPNTVTMTVSDGLDTHQVELRSDLSGSAALELTFNQGDTDQQD